VCLACPVSLAEGPAKHVSNIWPHEPAFYLQHHNMFVFLRCVSSCCFCGLVCCLLLAGAEGVRRLKYPTLELMIR
jgi:hypothetical protein